jgi:hypothetical protein
MQLSTFVMVGPPRFSIIPLSARRLRRTQARLRLQAPSALSLSLAWIRQHRPGLHRLMKLHGSDAVAVLLIHLQSRVSNFHPMHVSVVDTDCQSGQRSTLSCTSVPIALHTSTRGTEFPWGFSRRSSLRQPCSPICHRQQRRNHPSPAYRKPMTICDPIPGHSHTAGPVRAARNAPCASARQRFMFPCPPPRIGITLSVASFALRSVERP